MAHRVRSHCDEAGIKRKQVIPVHYVKGGLLPWRGSEIRSGSPYQSLALVASRQPQGLHPLDNSVYGGAGRKQLHAQLGAPDMTVARAAAEEEVAFAASLCDHPRDTLVAVRRSFEDGAIREAFRTLRPRGERKPMRAFSLVEVEGEEEAGEDVDLIALAKEHRHEPR